MEYFTSSVAETEAVAALLAASFVGGECVALEGELGAGKTQFVRGLVAALGGRPRAVSSPTYMLLNLYATAEFAVYHLDAYRVAGADDFEAIGFTELLEQGGIVVVEWASRVADLLPANLVKVSIETVGDGRRKIAIAHPRPSA